MNKKNTKKFQKRMIENQKILLDSSCTIVCFDNGEPFMINSDKPKDFINMGANIIIKQFIRGRIDGRIIKMKRIKLRNSKKVWEILVHVTSVNRKDSLEI